MEKQLGKKVSNGGGGIMNKRLGNTGPEYRIGEPYQGLNPSLPM